MIIITSPEFGLSCEYIRERKKRGKASRKDGTQQEQSTAGSVKGQSPQEYSSEGPSPTHTMNGYNYPSGTRLSSDTEAGSQPSVPKLKSMSESNFTNSPFAGGTYSLSRNGALGQVPAQSSMNPPLQRLASSQDGILPDPNPQNSMHQGSGISPTAMSLNAFSLGHDYVRSGVRGPSTGGAGPNHAGLSMSQMPTQPSSQQSLQGGANPYNTMSPPNLQFPKETQNHASPNPSLRLGGSGESPLANFFGTSPIVGSPGWLNLSNTYQPNHRQITSINALRYPVLRPLLPFIESTIPISLACDLLELYFTSSSTMHLHPVSPYILGYLFRKQSFLSPTRPRACSPALLSSMLWLAAQTSDSPFLTSPPSARGRVCQKLLEITISLLKPLVHGPAAGETLVNGAVDHSINGVALGGLGVAMTGGDQLTADGGAFGPFDNIPTYIHLAVIVSASEYKAASMRWWNAAWTLARELRLGRELPPNPVESDDVRGGDLVPGGITDNTLPEESTESANGKGSLPPSVPGIISEEDREERRRVWWLLYTVDRHLALCYNRPLFLLDVECEGLLQPMNDIDWQAGNFYGNNASGYPNTPSYRTRGPQFLCTGHSIFGYYTPLMAILGYIVDLNQARNHPRFGQSSNRTAEWEDEAEEIMSLLDAFGQSVKEFEACHITNVTGPRDRDRTNSENRAPSVQSAASGNLRMTESMIQTKIVVAYSTHIMHVLHILITGKWDPINLLDDADLWISTPSFQRAMGHAVAAAEAINDILEYDPDLSYMPFLFGISLLQGGFLLLLTADKLGGEANPNVVRACENIIKAHEACIVTLNTEYQVSVPPVFAFAKDSV